MVDRRLSASSEGVLPVMSFSLDGRRGLLMSWLNGTAELVFLGSLWPVNGRAAIVEIV